MAPVGMTVKHNTQLLSSTRQMKIAFLCLKAGEVRLFNFTATGCRIKRQECCFFLSLTRTKTDEQKKKKQRKPFIGIHKQATTTKNILGYNFALSGFSLSLPTAILQ